MSSFSRLDMNKLNQATHCRTCQDLRFEFTSGLLLVTSQWENSGDVSQEEVRLQPPGHSPLGRQGRKANKVTRFHSVLWNILLNSSNQYLLHTYYAPHVLLGPLGPEPRATETQTPLSQNFCSSGQVWLILVNMGARGSQEGHLLQTRRLRQASQRISNCCLNRFSETEKNMGNLAHPHGAKTWNIRNPLLRNLEKGYTSVLYCVQSVLVLIEQMNGWMDE